MTALVGINGWHKNYVGPQNEGAQLLYLPSAEIHNINKDLLWAQNGYVNVADTGLSQTFCFG